jgi:hypothetical protein
MTQPSVGRVVHYVSRGSADGQFPSVCRAAVITSTATGSGVTAVGLAVLNPTGMFFDRDVSYAEVAEVAGVDCPLEASHGNPFRYCQCGWIEATPVPGTWHWPERVDG